MTGSPSDIPPPQCTSKTVHIPQLASNSKETLSFAQEEHQLPSANETSFSLIDLDSQSAWPSINTLESTISDLLSGTDSELSAELFEFGEADFETAQADLPITASNSVQSLPFTIDPSTLQGNTASPSDLSHTSSSSLDTIDFPDSYLLPVPELTILRAFLRVATRLNCTASVWDLNSNSQFNSSPETMPTLSLPENWRPTPAQTAVPHHPVLDFLPWPSARDRIITILSLPDAARPPGAQGELAVIQLAYDMEDGAEGMRIWGGDPCDPTTWEVGQLLFERWWFIFDRQIIEQSNYWRRLRGAASLSMRGAAGSVQEMGG